MVTTLNSVSDDKGLSSRHLVLLFLAGVAVCGVFFSLGFLVGYNERISKAAPATEQVSTTEATPPAVNAPLDTTPIGSNVPAAGVAPAAPPPVAQAQPHPSVPAPTAKKERSEKAPAPAPSPAPRKETAPAAAAGAGAGYAVQVTASRARQDAEALVKLLKGRGYSVFLVAPGTAHTNDNLFRVQVGPFRSKEEADKVRAKLTQEGFKPFVKH